jgi:hypothetical protein
MFRSAFIEPTKTQAPSVSVQDFKKIVDIITPRVPDYEQYLKDKLVQYTNLFELNKVSPQPVYVEQMEKIINDVGSQTELANFKVLFNDNQVLKRIVFENIPATVRDFTGQALRASSTINGVGTTQTDLTKPPGSRQLSSIAARTDQIFYLGDDNLGTIAGTPAGRLPRVNQIERFVADFAPTNPLTNLASAFDDSIFNTSVLPSAATSGIATPQVVPEPQNEKHESGFDYP